MISKVWSSHPHHDKTGASTELRILYPYLSWYYIYVESPNGLQISITPRVGLAASQHIPMWGRSSDGVWTLRWTAGKERLISDFSLVIFVCFLSLLVFIGLSMAWRRFIAWLTILCVAVYKFSLLLSAQVLEQNKKKRLNHMKVKEN